MAELANIIADWGHLSLNKFWFPLFIWTLIASTVHLLLKWREPRDVLFHYHLRVALVAVIPMGILVSFPVDWLAGFLASSPEATGRFSLLVLQNPILVPNASVEAANVIAWGDPYLWIGFATVIIAAVGLGLLGRMGWHYHQITRFAQTLDLNRLDSVKPNCNEITDSLSKDVFLAFSEETAVPFTFGWQQPVIVIPRFLHNEPEKYRMAVRHELMHIKRGDILLNGFMNVMKSLLWFHPLIDAYDREIRESREISCDSDVLGDRSISRKKYAQLLFDLAPRNETLAHRQISMSVNQSTLQKRIKMMKATSNNSPQPIRKSIVLSLALLISVSVVIACSDLQEGGITSSEIQQTQNQIQNLDGNDQPLYIIRQDTDLDGTYDMEEFATTEQTRNIPRIKAKYIQDINVFKGQEAIDKFGQQATNGAVIINLLDEQKAFSDLKSPEEVGQTVAEYDQDPGRDFFVVVEEMPKLKGGLVSIQECVNYPEEALNAGIEGRVIVQFIVNKQGRVENPNIIRGIGHGADKEAIRCVKQAEFEPGMQRGNPVPVQYSLPVVYKLPQ